MTVNFIRLAAGSSACQLDWFKSSYSNGAGGECLECAVPSGEAVLVRDSKCSDGKTLRFGTRAWTGFLREIR